MHSNWCFFSWKLNNYWLKTLISKLDAFECDMRLTEEQKEMLFSPARNGLIQTKFRWPNKTVPYVLPNTMSAPQKIQTERALRTLESVSCVKFVERTDQADYVEVIVCQRISFVSMFSLMKTFVLLQWNFIAAWAKRKRLLFVCWSCEWKANFGPIKWSDW